MCLALTKRTSFPLPWTLLGILTWYSQTYKGHILINIEIAQTAVVVTQWYFFFFFSILPLALLMNSVAPCVRHMGNFEETTWELSSHIGDSLGEVVGESPLLRGDYLPDPGQVSEVPPRVQHTADCTATGVSSFVVDCLLLQHSPIFLFTSLTACSSDMTICYLFFHPFKHHYDLCLYSHTGCGNIHAHDNGATEELSV